VKFINIELSRKKCQNLILFLIIIFTHITSLFILKLGGDILKKTDLKELWDQIIESFKPKNIIVFMRTVNSSKGLFYIALPTFLTFAFSHFTVISIWFSNLKDSKFKSIDNLNLYLESGGVITTSISILVTSLIGYYFSPYKPVSGKPNIFKVFVSLFLLYVFISASYTYMLILNIFRNDNPTILSDSILVLICSLIALVTFNIWNFKADGASGYLAQEAQERKDLHKGSEEN
jgi:hypothetical protein